MTKELIETGETKPVKLVLAEKLRFKHRIIRFKGATLIEEDGRWIDLSTDYFARVAYAALGSHLSKSRVTDLEHLFRATAPDFSSKAHLIAFGTKVWDTKKLDWTEALPSEDCVYRIHIVPTAPAKKIQFIMDLACGNEGVYDDIMQSIAPLLMDKKPDGVIWFLGSGANGKSTLVHLLYKVFGAYLTELTVKQIEDERDTPGLNGKLGNVCKESSEGFIEDTRTYKSIGTHEDFSVHKFHSQDSITIEGNVHHIFSANNIPTFGDKSFGARRRTLLVPFKNRFKSDVCFEDKTFTPKFISDFLGEMLRYAVRLKEQGYEYKFSGITQETKDDYDTDANTAQTFADEMYAQEIYGFLNFRLLSQDYANWCLEHGYKDSSINVLRRVMKELRYERRTVRTEDNRVIKMYVVEGVEYSGMDKVAGRLGLYQKKGSEFASQVDRLNEDEQQRLLEKW